MVATAASLRFNPQYRRIESARLTTIAIPFVVPTKTTRFLPREREMPYDRDKVKLTLYGGLENREAVVLVVKYYSFDAADEGCHATIHARIMTYVLGNPMRVFW